MNLSNNNAGHEAFASPYVKGLRRLARIAAPAASAMVA
jgi:hypothetical protein